MHQSLKATLTCSQFSSFAGNPRAFVACGTFHFARNSIINGLGVSPVSNDSGNDEGIGGQVRKENKGPNDCDNVGLSVAGVRFFT